MASGKHDDSLTVMNFNTYLLEVSVGIQFSRKPNMEQRAAGIEEWFNKLSLEELPDVLVLNEIYSYSAERLVRNIACKRWSKNASTSIWGDRRIMQCDPGSNFQAVTAVVNATSLANPVKEGGVVVLVKRGLQMLTAEERVFGDALASDRMSLKGFWAVKVQKGSQAYWVLATHMQAWPGAQATQVRLSQFRQMRAFVDEAVEDGSRVCFAGDMNITTHPNEHTGPGSEQPAMWQALGAPGAPAMAGCLVKRGFWAQLDTDLEFSADADSNHYISCDAAEKASGSQQLDWIIAPGRGDRLAAPNAMRYQYVPVKASAAFASEVVKGLQTDDLSDHYAVFAQLWYGSGECPDIASVYGRIKVHSELVPLLAGNLQEVGQGGFLGTRLLGKKSISICNNTRKAVTLQVDKDIFTDNGGGELKPGAISGFARRGPTKVLVDGENAGNLEPGKRYVIDPDGVKQL